MTLANTVPTLHSTSDGFVFSQYKNGGPIIAVQVENEYGSYNKDPAYMPYIKKVRASSLYAFCEMCYGFWCDMRV